MPGMIKRSLRIAGHRTSVSLEEPFWVLFRRIAAHEQLSLAALAAKIDLARSDCNLSSAIRIYCVEWLLARGAPPLG
jgi:predicted DNA-binding ribbon-helix-helix protein